MAFAVWGTAVYLYSGGLYLAQFVLAMRAPAAGVDRPGAH
jgi:cardiolipin synthase